MNFISKKYIYTPVLAILILPVLQMTKPSADEQLWHGASSLARLHTGGADLSGKAACERGWEAVSPLPPPLSGACCKPFLIHLLSLRLVRHFPPVSPASTGMGLQAPAYVHNTAWLERRGGFCTAEWPTARDIHDLHLQLGVILWD